MSDLLLKSVYKDNKTCDILITQGKFAKIADSIDVTTLKNTDVVDCKGLAILPPFYNAHCHAAMTLLRGYADDMELNKWLREYIWPFEAKMTYADIEIGSRLAVLEMIKSGTVFFADMYWHRQNTMKVVNEMGIRATIGVTIAEGLTTADAMESNFKFLHDHWGENERIKISVMPHSVYMVNKELLKRCIETAREEGYVLNTHLSETLYENLQCKEKYGCTPAELFERCGIEGVHWVAAHCTNMVDNDYNILKRTGATIALNPCSNLKLASGIPQIPAMIAKGIPLAIGTDGASSNNNLDMHEDMKFAALLEKNCPGGSADTLKAEDVLNMATRNGAVAFGWDAGVIEEGKLADALLIRLDNERMVPCYNVISNWVYSADSNAIDSVICDGKFVMRNGHVDGEEDIVKEAIQCAEKFKR